MGPLSKLQIQKILVNPRLELTEAHFSDEVINRFQEFCSLLRKWNEKINLTSEKSALSILEKHVFDSLQYLRWLKSTHKVLDIGSGAGFPGIPIKILYPDLDLTLMDSQRKRCSFLREAIRSLKLRELKWWKGVPRLFQTRNLSQGSLTGSFFVDSVLSPLVWMWACLFLRLEG